MHGRSQQCHVPLASLALFSLYFAENKKYSLLLLFIFTSIKIYPGCSRDKDTVVKYRR